MSVFSTAAQLEQQNDPFAMVQIIESRGSTPRHSGQMLVLNNGSIIGTIGGGMIERKVIAASLEAIEQQQARIFHGRMAREGYDAIGSDCGGAMTVFISVHGLHPRLLLLGGGHVNQAIAHAAAPLGFSISVADVYAPNLEPQLYPDGCDYLHADSYAQAIELLQPNENSYVVIATNSQDQEALDALISAPVKYLGLLASRRKVQTFLRHLQQSGINEEQWRRLRAPIGLDIGAETPAEIAISVLAEILQIKNNAEGNTLNQVNSFTSSPISAIASTQDNSSRLKAATE